MTTLEEKKRAMRKAGECEGKGKPIDPWISFIWEAFSLCRGKDLDKASLAGDGIG